MKILIVTPMALPLPAVKGGGAEWLIQRIVDENEKEHRFDFTVMSVYDKEAESHIQKYKHTKFFFLKKCKLFYKYYGYLKKIFSNVNYYAPYIKALRRYLRKNHFDKIILENNIHLTKGVKGFNGEIVFHLHNDTINKQTILPKEYKNIDRVFCVSDFIKSQVLSTGKFKDERVCVLPNCNCMPDAFPCVNHISRELLGISEEETVFLYVGRIIKEKGVRELVEAFNFVEKKIPSKLVIVGGINYSNNKEDEYVMHLKQISSSNIIYTGYVDYMSVKQYYSIANIVVIPTLYFEDAAPLVAIEAMCAGIPVIASDSGGIWDFVNERCGIKIKRNENFIKELADKMFYLASSRETMQDMKQSALQSSKEYTKEKYFSNFVELINRK